MKSKINFLIGFVLVAILINCNTNTKQIASDNIVREVFNSMKFDVEKSFSNFDLRYETINCKVDKEFSYSFSDGTDIKIPADAFVDENGNPVKGEVSIKYKSIKSPGEIIASGLHLLYKQGDSVTAFQTGGMFEIDAEQNGKKLKLKSGSTIKMSYASIDSAQYNFYYFDKTTNEWNYLSDANTFADRTTGEGLNSDNSELDEVYSNLLKPVKYNEETDFILIVDIDYKKFDELNKYKKIMWKYSGKKTQEEVTEILKKKWKSTELTRNESKKGEFKLNLNGESTNEILEITPVLSSAEYSKAINNYNAELEKNSKPEENVISQTENDYVNREVNLINLGTYNIDVCALQNAYGVYAEFAFSDKNYDSDFTTYKYFVISNNGQTITRYNLENTDIVAFFKETDNKILTILPDNKVAVLSSSDFKKMTITPQSEVTFKLKVIDEIIENEEQLDEIIAAI